MQTSDKFSSYAIRRAWFATLGFSIWTIAIVYFYPIASQTSWLLFIFHVLLLLNTFYSIRSFASLTPKENIFQHIIDILLAINIMVAPFFFNNPLYFVSLVLSLFIIATLKYIFLVQIIGFSKLLYWKIKVDTLGILLCFLTLIGVMSGFVYTSSLLFTCIFLLANLYVLWLNPLYRIELHSENTN